MATLTERQKNISSIDMNDILDIAIQNTRNELIGLITSQLKKGESRIGKLRPYKSRKSYIDKKHRMNPLPEYGIPDLLLTGEFYKNIYIVIHRLFIEILSSVEYAEYLEEGTPKMEAFGSEIYELNKENMDIYRDLLKTEITKELRRCLNLDT